MPNELSRLLESCRRQSGTIAGISAADWWVGLHYVIYDTGERITAVRSLRLIDVDLVDGWVTFPAAVRKGGKRARVQRLHSQTIDHLARTVSPSRTLLFPWDRCEAMLYYRYKQILRSAGLPADHRSKFHRMRRTVASYFKRHGGDATELLGHSSRKVTEAYLDPRIVQQTQAVDLLPRIGDLTDDCPIVATIGGDA
jgi:integrase